MAVNLTKKCPLCGQDVTISGTLVTSPAGFSFESDQAGTRTAWEHQDKHDRGELGMLSPKTAAEIEADDNDD